MEGGGGWCRGGGVLVLPPRLLILALVNKLWQSSMEGMPVKIPSSRPIIDQNNHPGSWLCEISHPLVCPISRICKVVAYLRREDLSRAGQATVPFNSYRPSPTSPRRDIEDR